MAINIAKKQMKVSISYKQSTNLPKHDAKRSVETHGFGKTMQNHRSKTSVFYEVLREAMLSSLAKYNKLAKLKHVDSKKQLFARGVYTGSPETPPTSSSNKRPERRLMEG